jgi:hypothetical protein
MTPWIPFTAENIKSSVPANTLGVFQLSRGDEKPCLVERSDTDLLAAMMDYLDKGYAKFQWVEVPWSKEGFEMHCRLYHHGGGKQLDNLDHPYPPEGKLICCPMSAQAPTLCQL